MLNRLLKEEEMGALGVEDKNKGYSQHSHRGSLSIPAKK
jgi:hypothetical protein